MKIYVGISNSTHPFVESLARSSPSFKSHSVICLNRH